MTTTTKHKAQSAMEYLMTYGWAILIIAVVLGALFALGVFNGTSISGNTCIGSPGFLCSGAQYSHSDGNVIVTLGQSTGTSWTSANFVFVMQGTADSSGIPAISFNSPPANVVLASTGLASGSSTGTIYLPATAGNVAVGTPITGTIWVQYASSRYEAGQLVTQSGYTEVAALNLKSS